MTTRTLGIPPDLQPQAFAYEAITVAGTAIGFTAATYTTSASQPALMAYATCETASIRWRVDGTNPTASEGHLLNSGEDLIIFGPSDIASFRAIRTGSSATLRVTYSR